MAWIGNISYSLYLVHWPLFAFINNTWFGEGEVEVPVDWRAGVLVLSLLLAYLLNRYVEEPMRHADFKMTKGVLVRTAGTSFALVLTTVGFAQTSVTDKDYGHLRRINNGMGPACSFETTFKPIQECRNSDSPEILVWGDSFAMHLVPGIMAADNPPPRIVQATRGACGPLLDMAPMEITFRGGYNKTWAESCISFNDSVLQYLEKTSSIKTVVLASPFGSFINERAFQLLKRGSNGEDFSTVEAGIDPAVEGAQGDRREGPCPRQENSCGRASSRRRFRYWPMRRASENRATYHGRAERLQS